MNDIVATKIKQDKVIKLELPGKLVRLVITFGLCLLEQQSTLYCGFLYLTFSKSF